MPVLQTGLLEEVDLDETLELVAFEVSFEDVSFNVIRELVDALELLDFESLLLLLLFGDEVVFGKVVVLEDELVLAVEPIFEEAAVLDRVLDLKDVEREKTLEEKVVPEEEDTLVKLEPKTREDELLVLEDDSELRLFNLEDDVELARREDCAAEVVVIEEVRRGLELAVDEGSELLENEEELLVDVDKVVGKGFCEAGQRDAECCPVSVEGLDILRN